MLSFRSGADVLPPLPNLRILKDLVQGVRSIASIWAHLVWPATGLPRLCPFGTDKDVRAIYFIYGTVTRALVDDSLCAASDVQREVLSFDARSGVHPGHFEKIWHVLIVIVKRASFSGSTSMLATKRYFELMGI